VHLDILCPVCNSKNIIHNFEEYEVSFFGKIILDTIICKDCGFKHSDILHEEKDKKIKIEFFVENAEDLNVKVIKSSKCRIIIPEIGIDITPGPYSNAYITNIEGILERIENFIKEHYNTLKSMEKEKNKVDEILEKIKLMRDGKIKFKVILIDYSGISKILDKKAVETEI